MVRINSFALILVVYFLHFDEPVGAQREVLVRDRLVFLLCDQMDQYMKTGEFPPVVKTMPQKYKDMHPGKGMPMKGGGKSGGRYKRGHYPVDILDLNDELFHPNASFAA